MNRLNNTQKIARIIIVAIMAALFFSSCRMSKDLHKANIKEAEKTTTSIQHTDSSVTSTVSTGVVNKIYGDTLSGTMVFEGSDLIGTGIFTGTTSANDYFTDSLESNGVKVSVSLVKTKTGIKAKVKAIAKPKAVQDNYNTVTTERKAVAVNTTTSTEKKKETISKDLKVKSFPVGVIIIVAIALFVLWFLTKYKNFI